MCILRACGGKFLYLDTSLVQRILGIDAAGLGVSVDLAGTESGTVSLSIFGAFGSQPPSGLLKSVTSRRLVEGRVSQPSLKLFAMMSLSTFLADAETIDKGDGNKTYDHKRIVYPR